MSSNLALDPLKASPAFLQLIPRDFAQEHQVISQGHNPQTDEELIALSAQTNPAVIHNIATRLGRAIHRHEVSATDIDALKRCIDKAYETHTSNTMRAVGAQANDDSDVYVVEDIPGLDVNIEQQIEQTSQDLLSTSGKAPIVKLVDQLLFRAVQMRSSDIHIQPLPDHIVVRHRVDGVLDRGLDYPLHMHKAIVSRIKVMGRMDVAERLIPQDGRCSVRIGVRAIDIRISTIPTTDGERIVMRLLDSDNQLCDFKQLGMPKNISDVFINIAKRSSGIILVTGPTGSGKTTTLYSTLRELTAPERNIMTIEDPVEYELNGLGLPISQSQVNEKKGVNFANGLRHILRQDPDIIMVGEIRDAETARIAIQSSLTGHLVFSTLHTNDAPSAVTRLIDLGVEPYLVSASLSAVLAQRLVRTICKTCNGASEHNHEQICDTCHGTGLQGRTGIYELLVLDEKIKTIIAASASLEELRSAAHEQGMQSLEEAGEILLEQKQTTRQELERVIHG
ncbi:MAG: type II/IV secretion system protein [Planctomycetes bacterium]|nr:type II/IV secretion system protein [Planctomycetota bacterium]